MNKRILVTGASGFVGSWVCKKLGNFDVFGVVSPYSEPWRLKEMKLDTKLFRVDLSDANEVAKLFKLVKPEVVVHLATHGVYQYQQSDKGRIIRDNYNMSVNLLSNSVEHGVKKFINTGSVFEYGSINKRVKEEDVDLTDILNDYSAVKMATTALSNSFSGAYKVLTIRPFTVYGPYEDETRFMRATITRAIKGEDIKLVAGVVRDFVYVEDLADAYVAAVSKEFVSGQIVNVASGNKHTLVQVAKLIKKVTGSKSKIKVDKMYFRKKESSCWADISKAKKTLNWKPKILLEKGISMSVDFIKK